MKLKVFNPETFQSMKPRRQAFMSVSKKSGLLHFSRECADKIGLENGSTIELCQDEQRPKDWFVRKSENGYAVRENKSGISFNNTRLVSEILDSIKSEKWSARFPVTNEIEDGLYPIITSAGK